MKNIESLVDNLNNVLKEWCAPELLKANHYSHSPKTPAVSFEVCKNEQNHIVIRIKVRHDPFGNTTRVEERTFYSITYIDREGLEQMVFHALTWQGSPYYQKAYIERNKKYLVYRWRFHKRMELMG